jgi:hypothetical protein
MPKRTHSWNSIVHCVLLHLWSRVFWSWSLKPCSLILADECGHGSLTYYTYSGWWIRILIIVVLMKPGINPYQALSGHTVSYDLAINHGPFNRQSSAILIQVSAPALKLWCQLNLRQLSPGCALAFGRRAWWLLFFNGSDFHFNFLQGVTLNNATFNGIKVQYRYEIIWNYVDVRWHSSFTLFAWQMDSG